MLRCRRSVREVPTDAETLNRLDCHFWTVKDSEGSRHVPLYFYSVLDIDFRFVPAFTLVKFYVLHVLYILYTPTFGEGVWYFPSTIFTHLPRYETFMLIYLPIS